MTADSDVRAPRFRFLAGATAVFVLVAGCSSTGRITSRPAERSTTSTAERAGASTTRAPDPTGATGALGFTPAALRWQKCDDAPGFECTTMAVPVDWDQPAGETVDLAIARQPATGDRIGSLLTNPGGPGGSGLDYLFQEPFSGDIAKRFDIVSWDPRGVGRSSPLGCGDRVAPFLRNDPDPDTPQEQTAIDADASAVAQECADEDATMLPHIGTETVARDLDAIRAALGDDKLTYVGFSYGTSIGLQYLRLFPAHARAIVLDGVVDPTVDLAGWLTQQTASIDAAITRAFSACTPSTGCPVDDLAATYDRVRERVERSPLTANDGTVIGPAELATGTVYASYDPSLWTELADALADAENGDGRAMRRMAQGYYDFGGFTAYVGVACLDSQHPIGSDAYRAFAQTLEELSPRFGGSIANELLPCAYWPTPPQPVTGVVTGEGGPPVLVLGNRGDAATPYENSVRVAKDLVNGHLVSNDGEGHTSFGRSRCVDDAVTAYLIDLDVPATDPDCR